MVVQGPLGAAMPPAIVELFRLYPGLNAGFEWAKGEVKSTAQRAVVPYVVGAYAVGGVALVVGLIALFRRR